MQSVLNAPGTPDRVTIGETDEPAPGPGQAVVEVRAFSVNRGELDLLGRRPAGWRPGQDVAGVVASQAADGTGPTAGTRVVGAAEGGGWAERVAVDTDQLAVLPDAVGFAAAATLPVAGITALRTLRIGGDLLGRRVLITAASGAVGRFQLQLAALRGALPTAVAKPEHEKALRASGAVDVVAEVGAAEGLFALVTESVGGRATAGAISKVEPGGDVVLFGMSSGQPGTVSIYDFFGHEGARLQSFFSFSTGPFGGDLALLADLVAEGKLHPTIGFEDDWSALPRALDAFAGRRFAGKAVLTLG